MHKKIFCSLALSAALMLMASSCGNVDKNAGTIYRGGFGSVYVLPSDTAESIGGTELQGKKLDLTALREEFSLDVSGVSGCEKFAGGSYDKIRFQFVRNDEIDADWICIAFYYSGEEAVFSRIACITDGKISKELEPTEKLHEYRLRHGNLIISADENVYYMPVSTGVKQVMNYNILTSPAKFIAENERYLICESDRVMVYDDVAMTFVNKNIFVDNSRVELDGADITYILTDGGVSFTEDYSDTGAFQGYVLHLSADCEDEDVGKYIHEYMTVTIDLDEANTFYKLDDGVLYSADMTKLYAAPYSAEDKHSWIIPKTERDNLKVFTVPESVEYINENAFFCKSDGKTLDAVYVYGGVTDENAKSLVLWSGTKVYRKSAPDTGESDNAVMELNRLYADFFNESETESSLLHSSFESLFGGGYVKGMSEISYSRVSADKYTDLHFYVYDKGEPKYVAAVIPSLNNDNAMFRADELLITNDFLDGEVLYYDIYAVDIDDDEGYRQEALELKGE